ncbi:MAG: RNA polymerase sigma factor [Myxococcales bacterium]|jgi:RNA polymerase sigma factor (sigma-70 family)
MSPFLRIISGGKQDKREALRELYERHAVSVGRRCFFMLKDRAEAEDAMHEVFAKALENLEQFRSESSPHTWLMRIATHHCLNVVRSHKARWREEVNRMARLAPVAEDGAAPLEGRDLVRAVLDRFEEETQLAAIHYYVDEMTLEEVAAVIGRSVPTVRKRLAEFAATARAHAERLGLAIAGEAEAAHG